MPHPFPSHYRIATIAVHLIVIALICFDVVLMLIRLACHSILKKKPGKKGEKESETSESVTRVVKANINELCSETRQG